MTSWVSISLFLCAFQNSTSEKVDRNAKLKKKKTTHTSDLQKVFAFTEVILNGVKKVKLGEVK